MTTKLEKLLIDVRDLTDPEVAALRHIAEMFRRTHSTGSRHHSTRVEGLLTKPGRTLTGRPITRAEIYEDVA